VTEAVTPEQKAPGTGPIYLDITGMSCGMCSRRVEKALNKIDGVQATVSIATKTATVEAAGDISVSDLCAAVAEAGYGAELRATAPEAAAAAEGPLQRLVGGVFGRSASR
jgi:copper chaperone CopZ